MCGTAGAARAGAAAAAAPPTPAAAIVERAVDDERLLAHGREEKRSLPHKNHSRRERQRRRRISIVLVAYHKCTRIVLQSCSMHASNIIGSPAQEPLVGSPRCPPLSCSARRIPAPHACAASHAPRWLLAPKTTYVALRGNNSPSFSFVQKCGGGGGVLKIENRKNCVNRSEIMTNLIGKQPGAPYQGTRCVQALSEAERRVNSLRSHAHSCLSGQRRVVRGPLTLSLCVWPALHA